MDIWHVVAAIGGVGLGGAATSYFAMSVVRHKRRLERLAFAAVLRRHADAIRDANDPVDPRRIGYGLRLEAEQWQRAAEALDTRKR